MAITVEIFRAFGPSASSALATNNNWASYDLEPGVNMYYQYPVRRPIDNDQQFTYSFKNYMFAKISGTYAEAVRIRWQIEGVPGLTTKMYYGKTSNYSQPNANFDGNLMYVDDATVTEGSPLIVIPNLSTVGPGSATDMLRSLTPNTTYYTDYLVTQLYVEQSDLVIGERWEDIGNTDQVTIRLILDEYE